MARIGRLFLFFATTPSAPRAYSLVFENITKASLNTGYRYPNYTAKWFRSQFPNLLFLMRKAGGRGRRFEKMRAYEN